MNHIPTWTNDLNSPQPLTAQNLGSFVRGLPARAQMTLKALVNMTYGVITVRMPDGRTFRVDGQKPGPEAFVVLHNWNLPQRAFMRGTIGVAESYMDGDWDSPDVTSFLELFIVNMDLGDKYATAAGACSISSSASDTGSTSTRAASRRRTSPRITTSAMRSTRNGSTPR
jgi:cyclopropane-fatty-acyl-phospholipid synthase